MKVGLFFPGVHPLTITSFGKRKKKKKAFLTTSSNSFIGDILTWMSYMTKTKGMDFLCGLTDLPLSAKQGWVSRISEDVLMSIHIQLCLELTQRRREIMKLVSYLSIAKTVYDGNKKSLEGRRKNTLMSFLLHMSISFLMALPSIPVFFWNQCYS